MTPRLKSLELSGYKTFASRTQFAFPGDITAIVGPNGSGKSNIADSLRWVLGEQSYSLLRGRKTEDMIFSGSEQRPRASMASATITFSNEDGWLPIDFDEVAIARRAYRDGQNEYLLNGQRVRLKEIAELLGRSGLAERTYTIIGQGLVDAALSLKPEERRRFFEEAAGIGLYRGRRDEALTRLDTTRRNLERVLDILSELEPRLASLEKQAKRAQEYERIQADLRLLLRDWYGYHWRRSQGEIVHAREAVRQQETLLERARERYAEVEVQVGELRGRVQELRADLNGWHASSAGLHTRWEAASRGLAVMQERERALLNQRAGLEQDISRLEEEQAAREKRQVDLVDEGTRLQAELEEAQARLVSARKDLEKRQSERSRLEAAQRDARRALTAAETSQVQHKAHARELSNRLESLQASRGSLEASLESERKLLEGFQPRLEQQTTERQKLDSARQSAEEDLLRLRQELSAFEIERRQAQEERVRLESERARLAAQLDVLQQAERSLTGMADGARYLIQESQQGRLKGKFGALTTAIVVPAEYEAAIAAVLGERIDTVLLEDTASVEAALDALAKGKGRAALLPEGDTRAPEPLVIPNGEGCIGLAARLVQAPDRLRGAVDLLLGQAVVVSDRSTARQVALGLSVTACAVTLDGEIFHGSGLIVAGKEAKGAQKSGALGRARQIQELQDSLVDVEGRLAQAQQRLSSMEAEVNRQRQTERLMQDALNKAVQALNTAGQALQRTQLEVEQVRQRQAYQTRQLNGIDEQVKRAESDRQSTQAEIEKTSQRISQSNDSVREHTRALSGIPLEELQSQVAHWNTAIAVTGRALKDAERRQSEHREAVTAAQRQAAALRQRLDAAVEGLAALAVERSGLHTDEATLSSQIANLRAMIEPAEAQLRTVEAEYTEMQAVLASAQQAVTVAERHTTQSQLELGRVREAMESLRRRVEEDFGIVAFASSPEVASQTPLPLEGMVEQLPALEELAPGVEENITRQRALLRRMGPINPEVQNEYRSVKERFAFLNQQVTDLRKADADLREVINELDELMRREFRKTFDAVAVEFKGMFTRLFGGGSARLVLSDPDNPTEAGIDIEARLPGRREQGLSLLSGGERSLTAVALIFSLLKVSPTPFCVLDEVDAMLDEANVGRFRELLQELSGQTQFIVVTHNRNTVQAANVIYGITMGRDSASQVISLRFDEMSEEMAK